jgi:hypothetical protein
MMPTMKKTIFPAVTKAPPSAGPSRAHPKKPQPHLDGDEAEESDAGKYGATPSAGDRLTELRGPLLHHVDLGIPEKGAGSGTRHVRRVGGIDTASEGVAITKPVQG